MTTKYRRNVKKSHIFTKFFLNTDILRYSFLMPLSASNIERPIISDFPNCDLWYVRNAFYSAVLLYTRANVRNCYYIVCAVSAALSELLTCRCALSSSSVWRKTLVQRDAGSSFTSSSLCSLSNAQCFCAHSPSCDSQQFMFACWWYKNRQTAPFSCQDCGWMTWSCANMSGKRLRSHSFVAFHCTLMKHSHSNYIFSPPSCHALQTQWR